MGNTELNWTAKVVAEAIKKEAVHLAEIRSPIDKDIRHHQLCQIAERIATELYLHGTEERKLFLKACGVA